MLNLYSVPITGYQLKTRIQRAKSDIDIGEHEMHLISFVPDFWDMVEAYHLVRMRKVKFAWWKVYFAY